MLMWHTFTFVVFDISVGGVLFTLRTPESSSQYHTRAISTQQIRNRKLGQTDTSMADQDYQDINQANAGAPVGSAASFPRAPKVTANMFDESLPMLFSTSVAVVKLRSPAMWYIFPSNSLRFIWF